MKPHSFFSFKRFGRLLAADLRLNSKRYLYAAGAAIGLYLFLLFTLSVDQYGKVEAEFYAQMFFVSLFTLGIYTGSAFPSFNRKTTASNFLLFPASNFEKFLSQFLIYYVAGAILFIFIFWADAHLAQLSMSNMESVKTGKYIIEPFSLRNFWENLDAEYILGVMTPFSICGFLFTTRLFFSQFALVKSIISGIILIILTDLSLSLGSHLFFPETTQGLGFSAPIYLILGSVKNIELLWSSLFGIILIFFLPLAYFKLKEKQL